MVFPSFTGVFLPGSGFSKSYSPPGKFSPSAERQPDQLPVSRGISFRPAKNYPNGEHGSDRTGANIRTPDLTVRLSRRSLSVAFKNFSMDAITTILKQKKSRSDSRWNNSNGIGLELE